MPELRDQLVNLYKVGAAQDLSNVDVGFSSKTSGGPPGQYQFLDQETGRPRDGFSLRIRIYLVWRSCQERSERLE